MSRVGEGERNLFPEAVVIVAAVHRARKPVQPAQAWEQRLSKSARSSPERSRAPRCKNAVDDAEGSVEHHAHQHPDQNDQLGTFVILTVSVQSLILRRLCGRRTGTLIFDDMQIANHLDPPAKNVGCLTPRL